MILLLLLIFVSVIFDLTLVLAAVVAVRRVVQAGLLALSGLVSPGTRMLEARELGAPSRYAARPLELLLLAHPGDEGRGQG